MPHLLIAGTTGSGKSVCINTIILSLLYRHTPDKCKFILIDPKMLELDLYNGITHLLNPVNNDMENGTAGVRWFCEQGFLLCSGSYVESPSCQEMGFKKRRSDASYPHQRSLQFILAYVPTTASSAQLCLLCCQPEPIPGALTARMSLFTRRDPCRLLFWSG